MSVTSVQKLLRPVLRPFSALYALGMVIREHLYTNGVLASWQAPVPVVSVGNISWGGTGKTPLCGWLLDWAKKRKYSPALLTRGYGAKPERLPYLVSPNSMAETAGDEPLLLAKMHPDASIVVDPVRRRGGKWACKHSGSTFLLLDDGFQHMAVKRNLNLVLLNPADLNEDWNATHPGGPWREGQIALGRADAFLMKCPRSTFKKMQGSIQTKLKAYGKPVFNFYMASSGVRQVTTKKWQAGFNGEKYLLITGVGSPDQVFDSAVDLFGYAPSEHIVFQDHHMYNKQDVTAILTAMRKHGCEHVLCTGKDAVKLGPLAGNEFWELEFDVLFGGAVGSRLSFDTWLDTRWESFLREEERKRSRKKARKEQGADDDIKGHSIPDDPIAAYGNDDEDLLDMLNGSPLEDLELPDIELPYEPQDKKKVEKHEPESESPEADLIDRVNKELYEQEK